MRTYASDPALKEAFVAEVRRHTDLDHLIKGTYGDTIGPEWRGCAVGCAAVSWATVKGVAIDPGDHQALEREGLYPEWLARLEDTLFENLPHDKAMQWPLRLSTAIPVGVDIEPVRWRFCAFLMQENVDRVLRLDIPEELKTQVVDDIRRVLTLHESAVATGRWDGSAAESAAWSAESAAWSAAGSAAWSAAWSAAESAAGSAGSAAWSAAWSAARSAESAAWSAWSAARSAGSAAGSAGSAAWSAARSAAYERYADKLVELLEAASSLETPPDEIDYEIDYERRQLAAEIKTAYVAVGKARRAQGRLVDLYDVEYAEDGGRLASLLADADKALYAAQLIVEKRNA